MIKKLLRGTGESLASAVCTYTCYRLSMHEPDGMWLFASIIWGINVVIDFVVGYRK